MSYHYCVTSICCHINIASHHYYVSSLWCHINLWLHKYCVTSTLCLNCHDVTSMYGYIDMVSHQYCVSTVMMSYKYNSEYTITYILCHISITSHHCCITSWMTYLVFMMSVQYYVPSILCVINMMSHQYYVTSIWCHINMMSHQHPFERSVTYAVDVTVAEGFSGDRPQYKLHKIMPI